MSGVTIITPTGGRPEAFRLCQRWLFRQVGLDNVQWIVVDDVEEATPVERFPGWEITVLRPRPFWELGVKTLPRNLLAAIPHIKHDRLVIAEDDDHYASGWVRLQLNRLEEHALVAETDSRYYNVRDRCYLDCQNTDHGSLFQTAMRIEMVEILRNACESGDHWVDLNVWRNVSFHNARLFPHSGGAIGIKGLPGRAGIGCGHRDSIGAVDVDGSVLRRWIGSDAEAYAEFYRP